MTYGIIYKATNLVNGKVYIGQTVMSLNERKINHLSSARMMSSLAFHRAIRKYGQENFRFEEIDSAKSKEELDTKEIELIKINKSCTLDSNSNGYNMTRGGDGFMSGENHPFYGKTFTQEHIQKIKDSRIGKSSGMLGLKHSEEAIQKMSSIKQNDKNPFYGKTHSEESRRKMSESSHRLSGENHPNSKAIIQLTLDGEYVNRYESASDSAKAVNGDRATVTKCCKNKQKKHKGYIWMYEKDYLALEK